MNIKYIVTAVLFSLFINLASVFAAWVNFEPQTVNQPDGTILKCFASGDEFHNWLHDNEGYTIIQNHNNGFYYYADLENGQLKASQWKAGVVNPSEVGLSPWINISAEKMTEKRQYFLSHQMPKKPQLPGYGSPESVNNEGTLNNLVVYIRFSDQTEFSVDTAFYYNMYNNNENNYNSMLNYFETVSYDMISIPSWFYPVPPDATVISYQDIYERSYFMPYDANTNPNGYQSGQSGEREHALLKRACEYIEDEVPTTLNIDKNNDGYIDNMVFTIRGATTAWATLLWPHRWALYNENVYINGKKAWDYNLQVEDHLNGQGAGVLCHEMFHSLSAPDLYHYSSAPYTSVGPWDLMDNANNPPESMGAYMKYRYGGWIDDIPEITECGTYTLNPLSEPEDNCYKIASPNSSSQYFVVEYRIKEGIFEGSIPGSGLVVYRIDNSQNGNGNAQGPPDEIYVYRPGGSLTANGSLAQAHFAADYSRTEINDNTNPDPFLQNGQAGGLNIANIGFVGETISFDVIFDTEPVAEFSVSEELATTGCGLNFYDESLCEVDSWTWTFEGGSPSTSSDQHPMGITWANPGIYTVSLEAGNNFGSNIVSKTGFIEISEDALPEIEFFASDSVFCTGQTISLFDYSTVCPNAWEWEITPSTFEYVNGTNANSQHIDIEMSDHGIYSITLTVANDNGNTTITKEDYLLAGGVSLPFAEDFEEGNFTDRGWEVVNPDDDITWKLFNVGGNEGEKAAGINLYNYLSIFKRDQLITPSMNLSSIDEAYLSFDHAYAQSGNTQYTDSLLVKITTDCGENWTTILELGENGAMSFATHTPLESNFIPETFDDWCGTVINAPCNTVNISQWTGNPDTRIMFESVRLTGNNLFIDNVVVSLTTSIPVAKEKEDSPVQLFPNPASEMVSVRLEEGHQFNNLRVMNAQGKLVYTQQIQEGQQMLTLDLSNRPKGLYFISVEGNNNVALTKLVLQ